MKAIRPLLACACFGLAAFAFTGCSTVIVKKPAGDTPAKLDPKIWEGTWRGGDNFRAVITIKDPAKGQVELRNVDPKEKRDTLTLTVRELNGRLLATVAGNPSSECAAFFRVAATENHIVGFSPRLDLFKEAVASGKVAGEVRKSASTPGQDAKSSTLENVHLNQFGSAELAKMPLHSQGNVAECFGEDPDIVLVREKKPAKPNADTKQPGGKK